MLQISRLGVSEKAVRRLGELGDEPDPFKIELWQGFSTGEKIVMGAGAVLVVGVVVGVVMHRRRTR